MAKQRGPGAVAGPLAGVRAPQRLSAPPSSGLAAAPLWPDPGEPCPLTAGLSFPCARRRARRRGEPSHPLPLLSPFGFFDSDFSRFFRLGLGLGLGTTLFLFSPNHLPFLRSEGIEFRVQSNPLLAKALSSF